MEKQGSVQTFAQQRSGGLQSPPEFEINLVNKEEIIDEQDPSSKHSTAKKHHKSKSNANDIGKCLRASGISLNNTSNKKKLGNTTGF
jgi:hypothetical protein